MNRIILIFCSVLVFSSCKKENDSPQWDVSILSPLFKATLGIDNLVPDTLRNVAPDGAVSLVYDNSIYSTPVDSIFRIGDTLLEKSEIALATLNIPAGFSFQQPTPQSFFFDLGETELNYAIIKSGYARLLATNYLPTKVTYTFTIPGALLNGIPFQKVKILDAALPGEVTEADELFDMSGYTIDLTGLSGNDFNTIRYTVMGQSDPAGPAVMVQNADTIYKVLTGFKDLVPYYASGYLGQASVTETIQDNAGSGAIEGGMLLVDSVEADLTIRNSVGAEAQAMLTSLKSINDRTGTTVSLNAPSLVNHTINLNRAVENGPPPSTVAPTSFSAHLDNTNSNLKALIENLPEKFSYGLSFELNPLGNVSGHNDFLYTDDLFDVNLSIRIPLRFAANQIALADTQELTVTDSSGIDVLKEGTFTLLADNGFPVRMDLQLTFLDESNHALDSLFIPGTIAPAPLDANNRAIGKLRTTLRIPISQERKESWNVTKRVAIRASFSTNGYPQLLQMYDDYELDLKLIGDFILSIR